MYVFHAGEFELLSQPVGVPLVAFRLKPRTDEDGEDTVQQLLVPFRSEFHYFDMINTAQHMLMAIGLFMHGTIYGLHTTSAALKVPQCCKLQYAHTVACWWEGPH